MLFEEKGSGPEVALKPSQGLGLWEPVLFEEGGLGLEARVNLAKVASSMCEGVYAA